MLVGLVGQIHNFLYWHQSAALGVDAVRAGMIEECDGMNDPVTLSLQLICSREPFQRARCTGAPEGLGCGCPTTRWGSQPGKPLLDVVCSKNLARHALRS
jgi:hypothetical protein